MKEFDIINQFFNMPSLAPCSTSVIKGIGDDCAILSVPQNHHLVVSMDTLVSGRHFPVDATPAQIATRAFCTCLSDLAAMGATPSWFTLGLTLPESDITWITSFSTSLLAIAKEYSCELVGGDTTQGPLTITLQVHGIVEEEKSLRRDQAKVGDSVFVTGCLGDGAAALAIITNDSAIFDVDTQQRKYLESRFYCPQPQIKTMLHINDVVHAAIDVSDGLLADLQHIATASNVDIAIDIDTLPISSACRSLVGDDKALTYALSGGDDYQIAFTVPDINLAAITQLVKKGEIIATSIGKIVATDFSTGENVVSCYQENKNLSIESLLDGYKGYQHFAS